MRYFFNEYPTLVSYFQRRIYEGEYWNFTGRIMYKRKPDGIVYVLFEIIYLLGEGKGVESWIDSDQLDTDESKKEIIVCCNQKK